MRPLVGWVSLGREMGENRSQIIPYSLFLGISRRRLMEVWNSLGRDRRENRLYQALIPLRFVRVCHERPTHRSFQHYSSFFILKGTAQFFWTVPIGISHVAVSWISLSRPSALKQPQEPFSAHISEPFKCRLSLAVKTFRFSLLLQIAFPPSLYDPHSEVQNILPPPPIAPIIHQRSRSSPSYCIHYRPVSFILYRCL